MNEQLKFIVEQLNKEPFCKGLNLFSFDSLEPLQLLQLLTDVLAAIDNKHNVDIREESVEQTTVRMLGALQVLNYRPPETGPDVAGFRQGLIHGDKSVLHPLLAWLLARVPQLQKRAYLARYLLRIEIPYEYMQDEDVAQIYSQYEELVEQFKVQHKKYDKLKESGISVADIRKDIQAMEEEKDQLTQRVEKLKNRLMHIEQKLQRVQQRLGTLRQASSDTTPDGILHRMEQETQLTAYLVKERVPGDLGIIRGEVQDLQKVLAEPAMCQVDVAKIEDKIQEADRVVAQLAGRRMSSNTSSDNNILLLRQQVAILIRKKAEKVEELQLLHEHRAGLEKQSAKRKKHVLKLEGHEQRPREDEIKSYVEKMRTKKSLFKRHQQKLSSLHAECGVLARTEEVLKQRLAAVMANVKTLKVERGVHDSDDIEKEEESGIDNVQEGVHADTAAMVQQLQKLVQKKKNDLAPQIKELRPLRQRHQDMVMQHKDKKALYQSCAAGLESNRSLLEQEVKCLCEEVSKSESQYHLLNSKIKLVDHQLQRANDEVKAYASSSDPNEGKSSIREQYNKIIMEQEMLGKKLREQQKTVRERHSQGLQQVQMWQDLASLLECKARCIERKDRLLEMRRAVSTDEERFVL
uniref:Intraflagellar transport protein 81 homolog n=1 Tax=Eptatretus burgeri TaxID=7764 RepID=A0A8C4QB12_EPTBU